MDKVKINLFGESWSLKELELRDDLKAKINRILSQSSEELSNLLLDLSFYEELGIPEIKSIADLPGTSIRGLKNTPKSQVEIWLNGKKVTKIKLADIFEQNTLFKLYHTKVTVADFGDLKEGVYLFEKEIGLTACYQFTIPKFKIESMTFAILKFQYPGSLTEILTDIFIEGQLLSSVRSDTLVTHSNCIVKSL